MPDITEETIRELAAFKGKEPVTSVYLDVDGRRLLQQQQIERELESVLRPARTKANGHSPGVTHDLDRIEAYVRGGFDRSNTRGLAIYACTEPELWQVVALPTPVRSRVVVNDQPAVSELKALVERASRLGVLLVDRRKARMFVFSLGELVEQTEHHDESLRDVDTRARIERADHANHTSERADQHLHRAAKLAFDTFQSVGFDHFTANASEDLVPKLRELIHPYLAERYRGRIGVTPGASTTEIAEAAREVAERVELEREGELVERMLAGVATGRSVEGLDATMGALNEQRVDVLMVSRGFSQDGWWCEDCERVASRGRACKVCGAPMHHVDDVVEHMIEIRLGRGGAVEMVEANADLDVHGRIGATLRY